MPNCEEHIRFLAADESRKDFVRRASDMLKELVVFYRRVEKEAQQDADRADRIAQNDRYPSRQLAKALAKRRHL